MSKILDLVGTSLSSLSIGSRFVAGIKSLIFDNGFTTTVNANPTANRVITIKDSSGTLALVSDIPITIATTTGSSDAGKVVATNSNGVIDASFVKQPGFLLRRTLTSGNQTIYRGDSSEVSTTFGRNFVIFPETIFLDSIYSLGSNGRVIFNQSGKYSISASVRVKCTSLISGVTLEIVRRRGSALLRVRGQEFIYQTAVLKVAALAQVSIVDIEAGDTMGIEFVFESTINGFIETALEHSMCEFAAVKIQ